MDSEPTDEATDKTFSNFTTASEPPADMTIASELTDDPVTSLTPEQSTPDSSIISGDEKGADTPTAEYAFIEQEVEDDENDSSSTMSSDTVQTTHPMQSPKSTPEQEEVLRELKKLWDISEGLSDSENTSLKTSLSSIVHLAYARLYIEPDETLLKLKYLLQQLQTSLLGTKTRSQEETHSATKLATEMLSSSSPHGEENADADSEPNLSTTTSSPINPATVTMSNESPITSTVMITERRKKRSISNDYENQDDAVEAIFFANVNSAENSVVSDEKLKYEFPHEQGNSNQSEIVDTENISVTHSPTSAGDHPLHRTLVTLSPSMLASVTSPFYPSTTPSAFVQKVIHINDRRKPLHAKPSFLLSSAQIHELKNKHKVSSTTPYLGLLPSSTLSPISIPIKDDLENEVNTLQQQNVDHYDVHIVPLSTTPSPLSLSSVSTITPSILPHPSSTEFPPHTAEEIALALFQLLRPDSSDDDNREEENEGSVSSALPHPQPSNILYQVNSLSSVLNFITGNIGNATISPDVTNTSAITTSTPSFLSILKNQNQVNANKNNNTALLAPPAVLSDLVVATSTAISTVTEGQIIPENSNVLDYSDVEVQEVGSDLPALSTALLEDTKDNFQNMVSAVTRLSVGAKIVLLFSVSISLLSIGFGVYALGPPLAAVGVLGIVIPVALLVLFENNATTGKRKLTTRQRQQLLVSKIQSAEFSKLLDLVLDSIMKYSKGLKKFDNNCKTRRGHQLSYH